MITALFPPIASADTNLNYSVYDTSDDDGNTDWFALFENLAQHPQDAILKVRLSIMSRILVLTLCDS